MHCIVAHEDPIKPLTVEAGIVRISDALDMEEGRARIPFQAGKVDIHSVSALSIEKVSIQEGEPKPVTIRITMSNSAGVFQIDDTAQAQNRKLRPSKLHPRYRGDYRGKRKKDNRQIRNMNPRPRCQTALAGRTANKK